ncbi:hypothetical protein B0H19DRAFT_1303904, partial [Mycena capillaripes]
AFLLADSPRTSLCAATRSARVCTASPVQLPGGRRFAQHFMSHKAHCVCASRAQWNCMRRTYLVLIQSDNRGQHAVWSSACPPGFESEPRTTCAATWVVHGEEVRDARLPFRQSIESATLFHCRRIPLLTDRPLREISGLSRDTGFNFPVGGVAELPALLIYVWCVRNPPPRQHPLPQIRSSRTSMQCRAAFQGDHRHIYPVSRTPPVFATRRCAADFARRRPACVECRCASQGPMEDCEFGVLRVWLARVGPKGHTAGVGIRTKDRSRYTGAGANACFRQVHFLPSEEESRRRKERPSREAEAGASTRCPGV